MDKNFKIWGTSYGLIGDLVMSLPMLTYFEKKYPNSYKYFVVEKKCSQCIECFINHPLIDRIKVTDNWSGFGEEDIVIYDECDVKTILDQKHDDPHWYNSRNCIEETARIAGILDIKQSLDDEELMPKLYRWFPDGFRSVVNTGYSQNYDNSHNKKNNIISLWPFANYGINSKRSPSLDWWTETISFLIDKGYDIFHFGYMNEPDLSNSENYKKYTDLSFFEQVKICLGTKLSIGTDSGSMWIMGAYSHPSIHLMTYWMPNHYKNPMSLCPVNKNGMTIFDDASCDNISKDKIIECIAAVQ